MSAENLSDDLLAILRIVQDKGGTECSGSCHHRKPGELHCHTISQELNMSSSGVKDRILALVRIGLLQRNKLQRQGTYPIIRFTVSGMGKQVLEAHGNRDEK